MGALVSGRNSTPPLPIPELGPSLGKLCDVPKRAEPGVGARRISLDDVRLDLVAAIFELAAAARAFGASGDRADAVTSLSRNALLQPWRQAVSHAGRRISDTLNAQLAAAAAESRLPQRKLQRLLLTEENAGGIAARLGSGGAGFVIALDALERTIPRASANGAGGDAGFAEWGEHLTAAARQLEAAWLALESAAQQEEAGWQVEVERVRAWHRPHWPLWLATTLVVIVATYLGLLLGGYLTVPDVLRGFVNAWWYRS